MPSVSSVSVLPTSIKITLSPTDKYKINGILTKILLFYQVVDVKLPPSKHALTDEEVAIVLNKVDANAYTRLEYSVQHDKFFHEDTVRHQLLFTKLTVYTFYAFYLTYATHFYVGNRTKVFVERSLETGKHMCGEKSKSKEVSKFCIDCG